VLPFKRNQLI